jgi:RHS repeat-associated protein
VVLADYNPEAFTGKERDSESGLDYFGARYYGSALGRFTSPDWAANPQGVPYANLEDPQTLNLYGYVRNNPLSKPDPDGHDAQQTLTPEQAQEAGAGIADFTKGFYNGLVSGVNLLLPSSAQLPTAAVNSSPAGVLGTVLSMAVPVGGEASAVAEGGAAAVRAGELAGAMGKTKDFVTVAVTETKEGINVVSSSENALRPAVSSMLKNGEVAAQGAGHAEVTGIDAAKKKEHIESVCGDAHRPSKGKSNQRIEQSIP